MTLPLHTEYIEITDLSLCAALSLFYTLDAIDVRNPKAVFLFVRSPELEQLIQSYWKGELRVEPAKYFAQLKLIKTRLYQAQKEQRR